MLLRQTLNLCGILRNRKNESKKAVLVIMAGDLSYEKNVFDLLKISLNGIYDTL